MKGRLKVFLIICLCIFTFSLTSCSGKKYYNMAVEHIQRHLKDPDSIKVSEATGYISKEGDKVAFKIVYNAKNSFGAYTGYETIHVVIDTEDSSVECDNCTALDFYCTSMYSILTTTGSQIY